MAKVLVNCMSCGDEYLSEEPKYCCNGSDCGCMGMPIDPIICSIECYYELPMFNKLSAEEKQKRIKLFYLSNIKN